LLPAGIASAEYDGLVRTFLAGSIQLAEKSLGLVVRTVKEGRNQW